MHAEVAEECVVVVADHEELAPGFSLEEIDQAVRGATDGDIAETDHRIVVSHVPRPVLHQVGVAIAAVPERAVEDGDGRFVVEVRVGEDPRPVCVFRAQPRAQQAAAYVQNGAGGGPVVMR